MVNGFGESMSGESFSIIHGDLITEATINREVKVRGWPIRGGYSTSEKTTDTFIKTSHIMTTLRSKLKEKLAYLTSSAHKEITAGCRTQHDNVVKYLTNQLREYFSPFIDAPVRHFKTGVEIEPDVIKGFLNSQETGEESYKAFINKRRKRADEKKISILELIKRHNIATGLQKKKNSKEY